MGRHDSAGLVGKERGAAGPDRADPVWLVQGSKVVVGRSAIGVTVGPPFADGEARVAVPADFSFCRAIGAGSAQRYPVTVSRSGVVNPDSSVIRDNDRTGIMSRMTLFAGQTAGVRGDVLNDDRRAAGPGVVTRGTGTGATTAAIIGENDR